MSMLCNKMRLFVGLGLVCLFATSQVSALTVDEEWETKKGFYINTAGRKFESGITPTNEEPTIADHGIVDTVKGTQLNERGFKEWMELQDLFRGGGGLMLTLKIANNDDRTLLPGKEFTFSDETAGLTVAADKLTDETKAKFMELKHAIVFSEIMWGRNAAARTEGDNHPEPDTAAQWVELYVNKPLKDGDYVEIYTYSDSTQMPAPGERLARQVSRSTLYYVVLDRVATIDRWGRNWFPDAPGQDGDTDGNANVGLPPKPLVSMYRDIKLDSTGKAYALKDGKLDGLGDGTKLDSWKESLSKANMTEHFIGSPGSVHVPFGGPSVVRFDKAPADITATGIIINEVYNDPSNTNLDWVELFYNSDDAAAAPINIENYKLSLVMGKMKTDGSGYHESGDANFTETSLAVLPKYKMRPGEYLVVYNREPGKSVKLAGGVNVSNLLDRTDVNMGATHKYAVAKDLSLPATGKFLILLRTRNHTDDVGKPTNIKDYAGNGFFTRMEDKKFNTYLWPFVGWSKPGDVDDNDFGGMNTFSSRSMSFGRGVHLNTKGMYWAKSRSNRVHKDDWQSFGFMGAGYDRGKDKVIDKVSSPGTPGYPNMVVGVIANDRDTSSTDDDYAFAGAVTISEIMYDAGPRWDLVQWIELYNSSMTETVNLAGWEFEIRNSDTNVDAYVDASFTFDAETYIPPNQTLLLVSKSGVNDVPENYVYNLQQKHRSDLGLTTNGRRLLSAEGFHLELRAKVSEDGRSLLRVIDTAGNVEIADGLRKRAWELPKRGDVRMSIVRKYGGIFALGGSSGPHDADPGLMKASWRKLVDASLTYYGHRDDIGTPGYRLGGPLPVSLSSFRPVRDASTGHVEITWVTQSELNNAGFNILRSESKTGEFSVINAEGLIAGHGTTSEKHVYRYTDTTAKPSVVYYYQIEDVSMDGVRTTLRTTHLRGDVSANGKLTTRWGELKSSDK